MSGQESETRYAAWLRYVREHARLLESGKIISPRPSSEPLSATTSAAAGQPLRVVLCSPHPDDEALIGALPLRLRLELGATVTNCAITLGSDVQRRAERLRELESACRVLGFDLVLPREPDGFEAVSVKTRAERPEAWAAMMRALTKTFERLLPDVVFAPHAEDWHPTHIGTHFLVVDALSEFISRTQRAVIPLIETSYWHEHAKPNLMVGATPEDVATLVTATAEHTGEISRNPYHLRLPSRMIENVRRGAEVVGSVGGSAPDFPFADLYRVTFMNGTRQLPPRPGGIIIGPTEKIDWPAVLDQFRPLET